MSCEGGRTQLSLVSDTNVALMRTAPPPKDGITRRSLSSSWLLETGTSVVCTLREVLAEPDAPLALAGGRNDDELPRLLQTCARWVQNACS